MMIIANRPKLALELNASDTTAIHRAGMAGLWMSLRELEQKYPNPSQRSGNLTWDLSSTKIVLNWQGRDLPVIDWLLKQSFLIQLKETKNKQLDMSWSFLILMILKQQRIDVGIFSNFNIKIALSLIWEKQHSSTTLNRQKKSPQCNTVRFYSMKSSIKKPGKE